MKQNRTCVRHYNVNDFKFGFVIWHKYENNVLRSQRAVCKKPDNVMGHLNTKHVQLGDKTELLKEKFRN